MLIFACFYTNEYTWDTRTPIMKHWHSAARFLKFWTLYNMVLTRLWYTILSYTSFFIPPKICISRPYCNNQGIECFQSNKLSSDNLLFSGCPHPHWIADGVCDDKTNTEECDYDGGDCCGYNVNTNFCSDCRCYVSETCVAGTHPLVGDGYCNDETNNVNCNYDDGECCGTCTSSSQCTECTCLGGNDDTCHCKPNCFYYTYFSNGVNGNDFILKIVKLW